MTNIKSTKRALLMSVLSMFLCVVMLAGTTFAWFTDSVTSTNNIIKSGKLEVGMYWADGDKAVPAPDGTAWIDASKGPIFTDDVLWEPGYVDAKHILIKNEGNLDLNYELRIITNEFLSELADVIDVYYFAEATALTRATVKNGRHLGTLADVMGTDDNISNTVNGSLVVSDEDADNDYRRITLAFKMQESADDDYQDLALANFSVQLLATQMVSESDSFGNDYDEDALSSAVPAAVVRSLSPKNEFAFTSDIYNREVTVLEEGLIANATLGIGGEAKPLQLDAAYQFEPAQTFDEMMESEYKYYIADFVVSADSDVPADSIALAGYYDLWCGGFNNDKWVAFQNEDTPVAAGEEIRLVQAMVPGFPVHYKDICQYGNDGVGFVCGIADLTGVNAGTTVTVKLCLFKTDADPNGSSAGNEIEGEEPIVIGTFKYTFPTAVNVESSDALQGALDNPNTTEITLAADTKYDAVTVGELKDVTINGADGATMIFKTDADTKIENVTLKNVNFEYTGATADCGIVIDANAQIDNLVVEGATFTGTGAKAGRGLSGYNNSATLVLKDCTFKDMGYPIYAWGGYESLVIENCTFDNIKSWAIMPQSGFDGDLTVTGCTFKNCLGGGLIKAGTLTAGHTFTFTNNTIDGCTVAGDHNWFQFNTSAGTTVISGNTKDGEAWTPDVAEGLK